MAFRKTYRLVGLGAVAILSLGALANPVWAVASYGLSAPLPAVNPREI